MALLKRITTKDGEVYFVNAKTGKRVKTKKDIIKPDSQLFVKKKICSSCGSFSGSPLIFTNGKTAIEGLPAAGVSTLLNCGE